MTYTVRTEKFEGPLDALLGLIEKRKMHISDVSLAAVTDDFIAYVHQVEHFPLGESAHFILIASTLLLIKSKSLLPTLELSEEEQGSMEDLEKRLKEYQNIKNLAALLGRQFCSNMLFARQENSRFMPVFSPDENTHVSQIAEAIKRVIASIPKIENLPKVVVQKVISLEEMITRLADRITSNLRTSFKDFIKGEKTEKVNVIVSFLALLELVKRGAVQARQERHFDDIHLETESVGVPTYN